MAYFLKNNQDGSKAAIQQASMYYNRKWMTGCDADKTFLKITQRQSDEQIKMSSHLGAVERVNCSQLKGIAAAWVHVQVLNKHSRYRHNRNKHVGIA